MIVRTGVALVTSGVSYGSRRPDFPQTTRLALSRRPFPTRPNPDYPSRSIPALPEPD